MRVEKDYTELTRRVRRDLHRMPETGFKEFKTSRYIEAYLKKLGPDRLEPVAGTGWLAFFSGQEGKRTLAFRADMDGLPVTEDTRHEIRSEHEAMMHACGHDGHMAILMGLADFLAENRGKIMDNVLLIFQPAEEGPGGAEIVASSPFFEELQIDEIYGLHLSPFVEEGVVALKEGPVMAQSGEIDVAIRGRSAHGAQPHEGIDAVVAAASFIEGAQHIVSRSIKPLEPAVVTFGKLWGGEARNILSEEVFLEGTIRTFNESVYALIKERLESLSEGIEKIYGCGIEIVYRDMYPPVINDRRLVERFREAYGGQTIAMEPQMLAEDFSYYQKKVPGLFLFLGTGNPEKGFSSPLHSSHFDFDEEVLTKGVRAFAAVIR